MFFNFSHADRGKSVHLNRTCLKVNKWCDVMTSCSVGGTGLWPQTLHPKFIKYVIIYFIPRDFCCSMECLFPSRHQAPLHLQRAQCCRTDQRRSSRKSNVVFVLPALCGVKNSMLTYESTWKVGGIINVGSQSCDLPFSVKAITCKIICRMFHHRFSMRVCWRHIFLPVNSPFTCVICCIYLNFVPYVSPFLNWTESQWQSNQSVSQLVNQWMDFKVLPGQS